MLGKITFRIITDQDKDFLFALFADSREWEFELTVWGEDEKQTFLKSQFKSQDLSYKSSYIGAAHSIIQLDGVDIGKLIINRTDKELHIIDFLIHSDYQGRGIGSDILASLQNEAHGGKVPVTLSVQKGNPALGLYLRHDFKQIGTSGHHLNMKWSPKLTREI